MDEAEKKEFLIRIGEQIRRTREKQDVTAAELARLTSTERSLIARIETGRTNPTATTMKVICDALNISFAELFEGFNHK